MRAIAGSGQHGLGLHCLDTGTAERKGELVSATHRQDGVEQTSGGKNVHGGYTKIGLQGLVGGLSDDVRMPNGVRAVFVDPWIQGGHIHIAYFLALPSHSMQSHRTRSTPKEGFTGFQGCNQIKGIQETLDGFIRVHQFVPFTFPHFDHRIACSEQCHAFGERGLIEFLDASVRHRIMFGLPIRITAGTAMVETSMKLVDGASQGIVAIDKMTVGAGSDRLFAPVTNVTNAVSTSPLFGNEVFLVIEPLQGFEGLVDLGPSPPSERFHSNGVGGQMVLAPIQIASTGDGHTLSHRIEASLLFKFLLKGFTASF